ncbi:MAG: hypothetical protein R3277_03100 [Brumimicrobium sp.]|nr:hypothetical protein [Brumimicrobium sp.]
MRTLSYIILVSVSISLLLSCKKSKWKEPTDVSFMVDINKSTAVNGNLSFTGGNIILREIEFDGKRIQADDVYFESEYDNGLNIPFSSSTVNGELQFDIPQGTYTTIRIDFRAENSGTESMKVVGIFKNSGGIDVPVIVEPKRIEFYDQVSKNGQNETEIDLIATQPSIAVIKLNPVYWFATVSMTQMEDAQTVMVNGVESIVISEVVNEDIYDIIDDRFGGGVEIIFD